MDLFSHPDAWKIFLGLIAMGGAVFLFLILYLIHGVIGMRKDHERQTKALITAGDKRTHTITAQVLQTERRLHDMTINEIKGVYHQINPLRDRVARIEGRLGLDPDEEDTPC